MLRADSALIIPTSLAPRLTWNPSAGSYTVQANKLPPEPALELAFGEAQRSAAASNTRFDVYTRSAGTTDYMLRVYKVDNSELALTYASFAQLTAHTPGTSGRLEDNDELGFITFGSLTSPATMPRAGSATYSGVVYGNGAQVTEQSRAIYDLTGTSSFVMDFLRSSFTSKLVINGTNRADGSARSFADLNFSGGIFSATFNGALTASSSGSGSLAGSFYGPAGTEIGGVFGYSEDQMRTVLNGGFVAKR